MKPQFKIGDHVVFKGTTGRKGFSGLRQYVMKKSKEEQEKLEFEVPAHVYRVTDQLVETCYGGTQIHYNLRPIGIGSDGRAFENVIVSVGKDLFKAREIELEKVDV